MGGLAGDSLTDADYNVAIGYAALTTDTQGSRSTAVGTNALNAQNATAVAEANAAREQTADQFNATVKDAREKFSSDWTPKFLGVLCLVGFFGYIGMVTLYPQPDSSDDIVMLVIGSITGIATAVISFYFGSSNKK